MREQDNKSVLKIMALNKDGDAAYINWHEDGAALFIISTGF